MREENWHKMLMISAALHLVVLTALSLPIQKAFRKFDTSKSYYSVSLVGDIGPGVGGAGEQKSASIPEKTPPKEIKEPKAAQKKARVTPTRENEGQSIAPKKVEKEQPKATSKEDIKGVEERIREMKKRTGASDVASSRGTGGQTGFSGTGGAGGRLIDPALARYLVMIREKIETNWNIPFMSSQKKNLETKATIKVRKDGRIVDIDIDQRSGNRVFDESVVRVLRMVDPLPPLPSSVAEDPLEVELTLRPEGVS
jgi:TonB family protein